MKKIKLIVFILLLFLFILILFLGIFGTGLSFLSIKLIKEGRSLKNDLITNLKINNIEAIYEKNYNIFYYMLPTEYENKLYILNLELQDGYKYKIIDKKLNIIKGEYDKEIDILIYNDKYYFETKVQLTNLPLINIISEEDISSNNTSTNFNYFNTSNKEQTISINALMHVRGSTSASFDKKSYKINFTNDTYDKDKDINIENFYQGDSLILDAVYRDPSKIRNVLSIDLWNDISNDFNNINIYNQFVELFINNEYRGLYVLTEPINRTKLKLNKTTLTDTSVIIKTTNWEINKEIKENYSITEEIFKGYELKYPNNDSMYEISWDVMLNKLSKYYDDPNTYETIINTYNVENYIDMIIFNAFTNNTDNSLKKNNYFYLKDLYESKIFIQPWDMEYTFGLGFDSKKENLISKNNDDYNKIYTKFIHESSPEINKLLIERYWELRQNILTKQYFEKLLDNYLKDLNKGAALRDSEKWYEYDIEKELEDIKVWLFNRIEFFDEYVESLENEKS